MTPPPLDLAAHVARHAAGLRQLALELAGDASADDAVQETWLAAILHWPRHDASIGGWLATTLRNVVRGSRRQQRRREQREQVAATARAEAGEDHASLLARGEVAQRLIAAVLALDPLYGDTIWQRFFDDRTPRAIAAASGVPVGTVKSRLKRGLAMLRERLAEREGADWRGGFTAAFGLRAAATGVVIMATSTKVVVGGVVAAALLAALAWWPAAADVVPDGDSHGGAPAPLAADAGTRTGEFVRDAVVQQAPPAPAVALAPPEAGVARCRGRVIDAATKTPLAGAEVILVRSTRRQPEPTDVSFVTRDDGKFVFDVASDSEWPVGLWFRGPEHLLARSELSALATGQDDDVGDIALVRGRRLSGRITDEQGVPLPRGARLLATFATRNSRGASREHPTLYVTVGADGAFTLEPAVALGPAEFELVGGEYELRERIVVSANEPASLVFVARRRASIRGVVVDGAGSPLAGVRVDLWPRDDPQTTAGDGTFTLLRPNNWRAATSKVRVFHAPEFLVYTEDVAWGTADLRIVLTRTAVVPIEVIDDAGAPVQQFGVVLQREGTGATRPGTVLQRGVHEGGRLDVEGVDPGHTSLRVVPVDPRLSPSAYVEIATNEPQRFVLAARVPCQVEVRLGGQPVAGAQVEILFGGPERVRDHTIADAVEPHRGERAWIPGGPPERVAEARTDANGVASLLRDAGPGRCVLHVRAGSHPPFVVQDPAFPARVDLPGVGAIAGRVELRGRSRRDAGVAIRGSTNCLFWPQPDGTFRSPPLLAGTARVTFGALDASTREVEVRDGETTVLDFDFAMHPPAVFHGRLVRNGALPAGLTAELLRLVAGQRPATAGSAPVGADGAFAIDELQAGTYRVALRTAQSAPIAMPAMFAETFVIAAGEQVHVDLPLPKRRLVVRLHRTDGSVARGTKVLTRCDGVQWPSFALFAAESDGVMVFDPAPMLPVEFAAWLNKIPVWSAPVVMPPDRSEYEVTVVLPD